MIDVAQAALRDAADFEAAVARVAHVTGTDPARLATGARGLAEVSLLSPLEALRYAAAVLATIDGGQE